jgi:peptide/nickel transport system substrate-binding protein
MAITKQLRLEAAAAGLPGAARERHVAGLYPVTCRRAICDNIRSAPGLSNSPNSSRTSYIKVARNPDYWKPGLPYLDGIEYTIAKNRSTAILAFVAGKYEMTFAGTLTIPLTLDLQKQRPTRSAKCRRQRQRQSAHKPRQAAVRQARVAAGDEPRARSPGVYRHSHRGQGFRAAAMQPPPGGQWGMPEEMLAKLPGYGADVAANRNAAREMMKKLSYGPDKPLSIKISTRDVPPYRDPAVV